MKEPSKVEQLWNRVASMVPSTPAAPWVEQPRNVQDGFIHAVNEFTATGDYTLAYLVFQTAKQKSVV